MMAFLTPLYQIITFGFFLLIVWNLFSVKSANEKTLAAMVLITFLLRALLVK